MRTTTTDHVLVDGTATKTAQLAIDPHDEAGRQGRPRRYEEAPGPGRRRTPGLVDHVDPPDLDHARGRAARPRRARRPPRPVAGLNLANAGMWDSHRVLRVGRQLEHQHRQRLLRRPAVLGVHLDRQRRWRLRAPGRPREPRPADHRGQPALRQGRSRPVGLQALISPRVRMPLVARQPSSPPLGPVDGGSVVHRAIGCGA